MLAIMPTVATVLLAADVPVPGHYFALTKIILALVGLALWALGAQWIDKDTQAVHTNHDLWCLAVLGTAAIGFLLLFFVPIFIVGILLFTILTLGTIVGYAVFRDTLVTTDDKILTVAYVKKILTAERKPKNLDLNEKLKFSKPDKQEIAVPTEPAELHVYRVTHNLLLDALQRRASDVYFKPKGEDMRLVYRVDGVLTEQEGLDLATGVSIIDTIKGFANMDLEEQRRPQKSSMRMHNLGVGATVDVDVETSGTTAGQRMTLRLRTEDTIFKIPVLGFTESQREQLQPLFDKLKGAMLLCGGKESGLTSTLYGIGRTHDAFINNIHAMEVQPSMDLDNITQHVFDREAETSFARQLQSILRRDPDIVLVEPCQDAETARLVAQYAREGKRFYLAMEANSTLGGLTNWISLVGDPPVAAESLVAVTYQRLIRKLCPTCKEPYQPNPELLAKLNLTGTQTASFHRPPTNVPVDKKGNPIHCTTCQGVGYVGRTAVFEVMVIDDDIRKAILSGAGRKDIRSLTRKKGIRTWQEVALEKVMDGTTSVQEVIRVTKADETARDE